MKSIRSIFSIYPNGLNRSEKPFFRSFLHASTVTRTLETLSRRIPTIRFGIHPSNAPKHAIILFPLMPNTMCCGLSGMISIKGKKEKPADIDLPLMVDMVNRIESASLDQLEDQDLSLEQSYLGGRKLLDSLFHEVGAIKEEDRFLSVLGDDALEKSLSEFATRISTLIEKEQAAFSEQMGAMEMEAVDIISGRIEILKDIAWCLTMEIGLNVKKVARFLKNTSPEEMPHQAKIFREINAVLNSIDRLEVRGRDSAGISLLFILEQDAFRTFNRGIDRAGLSSSLEKRTSNTVLTNQDINIGSERNGRIAVTVTYKVAAEIGSLGDNIGFLREQIENDPILTLLISVPHAFHSISSHTRWASVGAISIPNCHPVDNAVENGPCKGIIHACLNGDIDNYLDLRKSFEQDGAIIPEKITTDTKIIPLQIEKYAKTGVEIEEAFRLAVNDFDGSHAIAMHTDLAPGKFFLAQKGSGQAVFIGMAKNHYMPASEVYGFIEETPLFLKMDGEKVVEGKNGKTQGQIFILDQRTAGGLDGIRAMYYDGTPVDIGDADIKHTEITSRDIDRQGFPHYFLKEISESPLSVEKTLQNRWKIKNGNHVISFSEKEFPPSLETIIKAGNIKRIFFVGQGTAGVAALACSDILRHYLNDPSIMISALKASELSGFTLNENDHEESMADALVVAISQSGTTTDTNRTVDMVRARGAHTLSIVNRRDSDITFKTSGVVYTSSGRDIEMSVASTKAFYSQIVAGAVISLKIAELAGRRSKVFVSNEIEELLRIPDLMRKVLTIKEKIAVSARKLAATKTYWAAVGSGPNKASADEIRIKLSELCYKTISSDFVEDKKHIDLSSEPLIIVCAAGSKGTVIGDIIKDTAIFKAHKAAPVVIADEGEDRFDPYAEDVLHTPPVNEHLAPILNTLVGHIWGYYAALAINEGSKFLHQFREELRTDIDRYAKDGFDVYEVVLEKTFRAKIAGFYNRFRKKRSDKKLPTAIAKASDLTLLFKYLSGRLPVSDFELDFGIKGTALNMINTLFATLGESINQMSRPVDAIKHQAKTVTVGTSRISEKVEGILFEALAAHELAVSQLVNRNIIVVKHIQNIISKIKGGILYDIDGLNLLGEPTDDTTINVVKKTGILDSIPSRVETDFKLKGTKRIIVGKGNVYIGKGRKDGRSIVVIPAIGTDASGQSRIKSLLLLNIAFKDKVPLENKIKALGGKYEHIKSIVQENSVPWKDAHLDLVAIDNLFGQSAEKIGETIVARANHHQ